MIDGLLAAMVIVEQHQKISPLISIHLLLFYKNITSCYSPQKISLHIHKIA
jgi:hypothetical protein